MTRLSWIALLLALLLSAVGALLWITLRRGSARGTERADIPRVQVPNEAGSQLSAESQPLESRSVEQGAAGAQGSAAPVQISGTGTLRIRVLDQQTHAPVPDLQFVVFRERGGIQEFGRGRTDRDGRAGLREVEANTVIVRTERKPPHAEQTGAVWLTAGATKELELLVGEGGAIIGRVIDDLQRPIVGAALSLERYSWGIEGFSKGQREPEARSAADGRFRIENLASRPGSVWIVDGQMRPGDWSEVYFSATFESISKGSKAMPLAGKDVDAGDIVLDRAAIYAGRVLDPNGRSIAGALLSLGESREYARLGMSKRRPDLAIGPGQPGFQLLPGEVLTNAAGEFEIRGPANQARVTVWTSDDREQGFGLPGGKPGERVDGIELKFEVHMLVELELVDAAGAPARVPASRVPSGHLYAPWRTGLVHDDDAEVLARTSDGKSIAEGAKVGKDGLWRFELRADPAAIVKLEVWVSCYEPVVEESATGFPPLVRRRLELREFPSFVVRLVPKDPAMRLLDPPGVQAQLHVCMADPARHSNGGIGCCGLGVYWNGPWRGEPLALTLPVRRKGSFWIYACAQTPDYHDRDIASIGPFAPGTESREFVLDPASFAAPRKEEEERKPPEPSSPGDEHMGKLRAHLVDSHTGKSIAHAYVRLVAVLPSDRSGGSEVQTDENGDLRDAPVRPGRWLLSAEGPKHKRTDLGERATRVGETLELGTIALEPQPLHRGQVIGADGKPPGTRGWLTVLSTTERGEPNSVGFPEPGGSFELVGELPARLLLQVGFPRGDGREFENQRFLLEPWPEDEVKELRLAPSRRVLVTVLGVDPDETELRPTACPAPGEPTSLCDHHLPPEPEHQALTRAFALDRTASVPRYVLFLAPGRYQLWGSNLMHELSWTELEVAPGDTDLELTITAH